MRRLYREPLTPFLAPRRFRSPYLVPLCLLALLARFQSPEATLLPSSQSFSLAHMHCTTSVGAFVALHIFVASVSCVAFVALARGFLARGFLAFGQRLCPYQSPLSPFVIPRFCLIAAVAALARLHRLSNLRCLPRFSCSLVCSRPSSLAFP
ncbi:hypothetical protein BD626DRAFT_472178 [Schizophyllum amplum]|uniref:Transmembrane protein n=1 Tax=Schizophyllum amplum TaxID=97359 RepID=A0A550CVQ6_9AGAR|nr:hypothetical protein BD626DRAFT_472178 [Auriculariopsis ampla]